MRGDTPDRTCISWWFPRIVAAGLPVPKTTILKFPEDQREKLIRGFMDRFDMKELNPEAKAFLDRMSEEAKRYGAPFFLRTGQTSGKHEWSATCFVEDPTELERHVMMLIQYSELADFMGLPWDVWAVREFLQLRGPGRKLPEFMDMPLSDEWRFFVEDGHVTHIQPYWPKRALVDGGMTLEEAKAYSEQQQKLAPPFGLYDLSRKAAEACEGGGWSVDWCHTLDDRWILTDMAEAAQSFKYTPTDPDEVNLNSQEYKFDDLLREPNAPVNPA